MEFTNYRTRVQAPDSQVFNLPNTPSHVLNDDIAPNLSRRASSDGEKTGLINATNRILSQKSYTFFCSFNARTLSPTGRFEELVSNSSMHHLDIIAVQEHRFYHPKEALKYQKSGKFTVSLFLRLDGKIQ